MAIIPFNAAIIGAAAVTLSTECTTAPRWTCPGDLGDRGADGVDGTQRRSGARCCRPGPLGRGLYDGRGQALPRALSPPPRA